LANSTLDLKSVEFTSNSADNMNANNSDSDQTIMGGTFMCCEASRATITSDENTTYSDNEALVVDTVMCENERLRVQYPACNFVGSSDACSKTPWTGGGIFLFIFIAVVCLVVVGVVSYVIFRRFSRTQFSNYEPISN